jgi:hypothetical protein
LPSGAGENPVTTRRLPKRHPPAGRPDAGLPENHDPSGPLGGFHPSSQPGHELCATPGEILHIGFSNYTHRSNLYICFEKIDEINKRVNGDFQEETEVCIGFLHGDGKSRTVLRIEI